ncbi:MAG: preprotein translocase subunit YajC [Alphaproteobacteria bacterium]|jgi:preprotein translocase subunit YajC|nr:preprotein translocase subunit YajC [Alphaproteobacteria bacterium]MBT5390261.1 preprotein translocase subunit YajC [Alphaproteobacteria bacterium]MBT5540276.1 preprotein translocase subunit YajC [Alphaproteobacteria bacterium]MBT5654227.1 preprotein translocase subunit YajC [Alphaproteobacteria bacterium]
MDLFINYAYAQGATVGGFDIMSLVPFVLMFGIAYVLLIRPQQKKAKEHRELLASLKKGDRVVSTGGLLGVITKVLDEREIEVEIASGVQVRMVRSMISNVVDTSSSTGKTAPSKGGRSSTVVKMSGKAANKKKTN